MNCFNNIILKCVLFFLLFLVSILSPKSYADKSQHETIKLAQNISAPGHIINLNDNNNSTTSSSTFIEREDIIKKEMNEWTLGLASGRRESTSTRFAEELSSVLDDGNKMYVLPIITRGTASNIEALLYMKGMDLAVINADIFEHYKKQITNIENRINYITQLFLSEVHIIARPEIKKIEDLRGKTINFNSKGTAASFSGPKIFDLLGIKVKEKYLPQAFAIKEMMVDDEISATIYVTGKPINFLRYNNWPKGFHLLPIEYNAKLLDQYLPTTIKKSDYPDLITNKEGITTIAVPTILAAYNWKKNTKRYQKVKRFVNYIFQRWETLRKPPFDEKWREINLSANITGWKRLPIVTEYLKRVQNVKVSTKPKNVDVPKYANVDTKLKRAYDRFLKSYAKANDIKTFTAKQKETLFVQFYKFWKETGR